MKSKRTQKQQAPAALDSMRLLACPWCHSTKIMAEGNQNGRVIAMVCQRCGARGPEDRNARDGHAGIARIYWNDQYWHEEIRRLIANANRDNRRAHVAQDDLEQTMIELKLEKERTAKIINLVGKKKMEKLWRKFNQGNVELKHGANDQ